MGKDKVIALKKQEIRAEKNQKCKRLLQRQNVTQDHDCDITAGHFQDLTTLFSKKQKNKYENCDDIK